MNALASTLPPRGAGVSPPAPSAWTAIGVAMFGAACGGVSAQLNALGLPEIGAQLGVSADEASWLLTVQVMAEACAIPLVARIAGTLGMRRLALGAACLFGLAALGGWQSEGLAALMAWRAAQGLAGGCFAVMMMVAVMGGLAPGPTRLIGLVLYGITLSLPAFLSPMLFRTWLEPGLWRELLGFDALWSLAYAALAWFLLPRSRPDWAALRATDWPSYIALAVGMALLMIALTQGERRFWLDCPWVVMSLAGAAVALCAALVLLLKRPAPLLDLNLLRRRSFSVALVLSLFLRLGLLVTAWVLPQHWSRLNGLRPEQWALPFLGLALWMPAVGVGAWLLARRLDARYLLAIGLAGFAVAAAWASRLESSSSLTGWLPVAEANVLAQTVFVVGLLVAATSGVPKEHGATAAGLFNLARLIGQWGGTAVLATLLTEREKFHSAQLVEHSGSLLASEQILQLAGQLSAQHGDLLLAQEQALRSLATRFSQQAFALAFSDVLVAMAVMLLVGLGVLMLMPSVKA